MRKSYSSKVKKFWQKLKIASQKLAEKMQQTDHRPPCYQLYALERNKPQFCFCCQEINHHGQIVNQSGPVKDLIGVSYDLIPIYGIAIDSGKERNFDERNKTSTEIFKKFADEKWINILMYHGMDYAKNEAIEQSSENRDADRGGDFVENHGMDGVKKDEIEAGLEDLNIQKVEKVVENHEMENKNGDIYEENLSREEMEYVEEFIKFFNKNDYQPYEPDSLIF